ncbi:MAG: DUF2059 domain-containing protein [Erythrobacter sp.]|uniref:DUF2059 domain-containing protein n=1 Tax=Erythrobacter sp. TaxID=1042 RepID=UPI00326608DA
MKRLFLAATTGLALSFTVPVAAQTETSAQPSQEEIDAIADLFGDMFVTPDPLSPEEEARLGEAMIVVTKLFPEGTYSRMMEETMAPMLEEMIGGLGGSPALALRGLTGVDSLTLGAIDDDKLKAAVALLDPAAAERNAAMGAKLFELMSEVVVEIEPAYRAGLARAYAVRFSQEELADLSAYFDTAVGKKYAAESFVIFADPQVMSAMNELMPAIMQRMPSMFELMGSIGAEFPEGRSFSALDAQERAKLASLLGISEEELAEVEPAAMGDGF